MHTSHNNDVGYIIFIMVIGIDDFPTITDEILIVFFYPIVCNFMGLILNNISEKIGDERIVKTIRLVNAMLTQTKHY